MKNISNPLFFGILIAILGANAGHAEFKESLGNGVNQKRMEQYGSKNGEKYMGNAYRENNKYGNNNGNKMKPVYRPGPIYGPKPVYEPIPNPVYEPKPIYGSKPKPEMPYNIPPRSQNIIDTEARIVMAPNAAISNIGQEPINDRIPPPILPVPVNALIPTPIAPAPINAINPAPIAPAPIDAIRPAPIAPAPIEPIFTIVSRPVPLYPGIQSTPPVTISPEYVATKSSEYNVETPKDITTLLPATTTIDISTSVVVLTVTVTPESSSGLPASSTLSTTTRNPPVVVFPGFTFPVTRLSTSSA
ncbi:hypothetical protein BB559_000426 [Furculomyces boomerangus]|uniref:Uncharacterized protein n=2 Tax=Harpellales TaxID=61421 RepID=A0A2T9Z583_9FUNG|nr:hypothetical protein BB559_000426 [Furculomyces boomerangus]PWA00699.1 hypothetical protein BB558_003242 [Smittium angustum]